MLRMQAGSVYTPKTSGQFQNEGVWVREASLEQSSLGCQEDGKMFWHGYWIDDKFVAGYTESSRFSLCEARRRVNKSTGASLSGLCRDIYHAVSIDMRHRRSVLLPVFQTPFALCIIHMESIHRYGTSRALQTEIASLQVADICSWYFWSKLRKILRCKVKLTIRRSPTVT